MKWMGFQATFVHIYRLNWSRRYCRKVHKAGHACRVTYMIHVGKWLEKTWDAVTQRCGDSGPTSDTLAHYCETEPANPMSWAKAGLMLGRRRRRWPNIKPTLSRSTAFSGWNLLTKVPMGAARRGGRPPQLTRELNFQALCRPSLWRLPGLDTIYPMSPTHWISPLHWPGFYNPLTKDCVCLLWSFSLLPLPVPLGDIRSSLWRLKRSVLPI